MTLRKSRNFSAAGQSWPASFRLFSSTSHRATTLPNREAFLASPWPIPPQPIRAMFGESIFAFGVWGSGWARHSSRNQAGRVVAAAVWRNPRRERLDMGTPGEAGDIVSNPGTAGVPPAVPGGEQVDSRAAFPQYFRYTPSRKRVAMSRTVIPLLALAISTSIGRGDEPTETRAQALLGILGDVLPDGQGFKVSGIIEDGPSTRLTRPDNPAAVGQILEGDTVVRIAGKKFKSWRQWYDRLNAAYRTGKGEVRITVRAVDGTESDWVVRPAVADVAVPSEGVPLIAVPDLDDVPDPIFPKVRDLPKPKK